MKIILSCTTTYERQDIFYYGLQSLLKQSLKPDLFLVNLSKQPYLKDSGFTDLPSWLKNDKLKINWVENTGSYRKLLPALDFAGDEDLIITADDDVLYGNEWLEKMINYSRKNSDAVVCSRGRKMNRNFLNRWKNYDYWERIYKNTKSKFIMPVGVSGVVYRKQLLDLEFITDTAFLELAPKMDDLWFKMASFKKDTPIALYPDLERINIYLLHEKGLAKTNYTDINENVNFIILKEFNRIKKKIDGHLGISRTENDHAWKGIWNYCNPQN
jgi:hypothetical protein